MVDNLIEALEADTTLADVTIEEANTDDDVWKLAKLGHLLGGSEGDEWTQTSSRKNGFESSGDLAFNSVWNGGSQLDVRVLANNMLLILVQQVIEDLSVEQGDAFEVITWAWLKAYYFID